jgi:hypothetical protein
MGDMADYYIDQAMFYDDYGVEDGDYEERDYEERRKDRAIFMFGCTHWVDGKGNVRYPHLPPTHKRGMTMEHVQAIKAKLLKEYGAERVEGTPLWKALCKGEKMHEGELRKAKDINKGVIKW